VLANEGTGDSKIRGSSKTLAKHLLVKQPGHADPVMQIQQLEPARARAGHAARLKWALGYLQKKDWWVIRRPAGAPDSAPEDEAPERPKKDKRGTKNMVADLIVAGDDLPTIVMKHPDLRGFISTNVRQLREFGDMMTKYRLRMDPVWPEVNTEKWVKIRNLLEQVAVVHFAEHVSALHHLSFQQLKELGMPSKLKLFGPDGENGLPSLKNWWMHKIVTWIMGNFCCPRNREVQKHMMIQSETGHGKTGLIDALGRMTTVYGWCYENGIYQTAPADMDMIVFDEFQCNLALGMINSICDARFQINAKNEQPKKMEWDVPCIMLTNIVLEDHYSKLIASLKEKGMADADNLIRAYRRRWEYVEIPGPAEGLGLKPLTNVIYHLGTALLKNNPVIKKHRRILEATSENRPIPDWAMESIEQIKNM